MLFYGRLVETVKHTHKGTSFTNQQWQWAPEVNKGTFGAKRNVDSHCRIVPMSIKNKRAYISNAEVMCAKSTVVDNGQVFIVLFTGKVVTCSVIYC